MIITVYAITAAGVSLFVAGVYAERRFIGGRAERCRACPSDMCLVAYANRRRHDRDATP